MSKKGDGDPCGDSIQSCEMSSTATVIARIGASSWSGSISSPYVSRIRNHFFEILATPACVRIVPPELAPPLPGRYALIVAANDSKFST